MLGRFSASRRARSTISLLLLFFFTVLLEYLPDHRDVGGDVCEREHRTDDFFARNHMVRLRDVHGEIVAKRRPLRKMTDEDGSALAGAARARRAGRDSRA